MRTLVAASLCAVLVLTGAVPVTARTRPVESFVRHVDISFDHDGRVEKIEGVVDAKTDRCVGDRDVAVYVDPNGSSRKFGETKTDDDGDFSVRGDDAAGLDYAIAVFDVRRDRLRCLGKAVVVRAVES
jgi:hypothetical protein